MYPQIISSLICQTCPDWELYLIHNGPIETRGLVDHVAAAKDERIRMILNHEETGNYGHPLRLWALQDLREGLLSRESTHVVITNADNYYMPAFVEAMLGAFDRDPNAVAAYCSQMVHNYMSTHPTVHGPLPPGQPSTALTWESYRWGVTECRLERGYIDCGGVMLRKDAACSIDWPNFEHSSDWTYFANLIEKYGAERWKRVPGCLFVHN